MTEVIETTEETNTVPCLFSINGTHDETGYCTQYGWDCGEFEVGENSPPVE